MCVRPVSLSVPYPPLPPLLSLIRPISPSSLIATSSPFAGRGAEEACRAGACHQLEATAGVHPHPLARRRSCQSHSLDLEHYRGTPTPLLQDVAPRGKSLDSTSVSSLRRSPTAGPSWAGGDPVCTTPELRVSPTPPDASTPSTAAHHHPHHILLQRQETIDDALLPVPYATLMEEEMENEVSEV